MDIKYEIQLFNYWHCGSGLAAGAEVDLLVIKDGDGLPFIPGKTIKGLIREAAEDITAFSASEDTADIVRVFGNSADRNNLDGCDDITAMRQGEAFFSDAVLAGGRKEIVDGSLAQYMYTEMSATAIGDDGVALPHSLRKMEVAMPCVLEGYIMNVPDNCADLVRQSLKYIKRIGQNRNRGLGRCQIYTK